MRLYLLLAVLQLLFLLQVFADDTSTTTRAPGSAQVITFYAPIRVFNPHIRQVSSTSSAPNPTTTAAISSVAKPVSPKTPAESLSPKLSIESSSPPEQRCHEFEIQADEEDCKYFYFCWLTGSFRAKCPPGTLFDRNIKRCQDKNFVRCFNGRTCPQSKGLFPDTKFCNMYLNCFQGVPYLRKCPPGLLFHPASLGHGFCDYPYNVQCPGNTIITVPDSNSRKVSQTNAGFDPRKVLITAGLPEYSGRGSDS